MTHEEFNELYDNGKITVKIYSGVIDGVEKCIEAFEYVTGERAFGKRYRMSRESHYIKEFDNRKVAINYFKKAAEGLKRIA